jgi:uncharacterized protein YbcI
MAWRVEHLSSVLAEAIAQFQEEEMGTRPAEVSMTVGEDLVMVHLKDVLTPSEHSLARTEAGQAVLQRFNTLRFNAAPSDKVQQSI